MSFYENTLVAKQDLPESELKKIKEKYNDLINSSSGKVVKIEEWGLLNFATKIRRYNGKWGASSLLKDKKHSPVHQG